MSLPDNPRSCYCGLWQTNPELLRQQGCAEGHCGTCERCGKQGHTRHYPGPVPRTGAWCDRCYRIVGRTHFLRSPLFWVVLLTGLWAAVKVVTRG